MLTKTRLVSAPAQRSSGSEAVTVISDTEGVDNDAEDVDDDADNDCVLSDEDDLVMPKAVKASLVTFFNNADIQELTLVRGCSIIKAGKVCGLRPFDSWSDLVLNTLIFVDDILTADISGCEVLLFIFSL